MLASSEEPLWRSHDLIMLDLDGVVYVGGDAVIGAPGHLRAARQAGTHLAFVTNNASRTPAEVAGHLRSLDIEADPADVVTSAQAAARLLLDRFGPGARILALGADGLQAALDEAGLVPVNVDDDDDRTVALVTGYGPDVLWRDVMRACVRVRAGLPWVASNTDLTIPTAYGVAPGHGVLVETVTRFAGVTPTVAGKPARPLLDETVRRVGGARPLMVGDRLDTDIEGARRIELPSLLVMTGVTGLAELIAARPEQRPTYLSHDLAGLGEAHRAPSHRDGETKLDGWTARTPRGVLQVDGEGAPDDWWRVVAVAAWTHQDETGAVPSAEGVTAPAPHSDGGR